MPNIVSPADVNGYLFTSTFPSRKIFKILSSSSVSNATETAELPMEVSKVALALRLLSNTSVTFCHFSDFKAIVNAVSCAEVSLSTEAPHFFTKCINAVALSMAAQYVSAVCLLIRDSASIFAPAVMRCDMASFLFRYAASCKGVEPS